jgi:hypothetical protein
VRDKWKYNSHFALPTINTRSIPRQRFVATDTALLKLKINIFRLCLIVLLFYTSTFKLRLSDNMDDFEGRLF